uniref:Uncharacterized protein n=1 Tax=Biomphalaria glabrata TaxID=6526 RepID=A0A182YU13_BIOGL
MTSSLSSCLSVLSNQRLAKLCLSCLQLAVLYLYLSLSQTIYNFVLPHQCESLISCHHREVHRSLIHKSSGCECVCVNVVCICIYTVYYTDHIQHLLKISLIHFDTNKYMKL